MPQEGSFHFILTVRVISQSITSFHKIACEGRESEAEASFEQGRGRKGAGRKGKEKEGEASSAGDEYGCSATNHEGSLRSYKTTNDGLAV